MRSLATIAVIPVCFDGRSAGTLGYDSADESTCRASAEYIYLVRGTLHDCERKWAKGFIYCLRGGLGDRLERMRFQRKQHYIQPYRLPKIENKERVPGIIPLLPQTLHRHCPISSSHFPPISSQSLNQTFSVPSVPSIPSFPGPST
jgi:hypothetical protein